jgi:hypothetical protein
VVAGPLAVEQESSDPVDVPLVHAILSAIQSEPDLHGYLPVRNLIILELAAHLGDFKPPHIADCFASSTDRVIHCVFDTVRRGTDQFDLFVDVVTHDRIKAFQAASGEHIPKSRERENRPLAAKTNRLNCWLAKSGALMECVHRMPAAK